MTITITGTHNSAIVYTDSIEVSAKEQIQNLCDSQTYKSSSIRIMPDVHAGIGATIGTTMTLDDEITPSMVGVDIGCGMLTVFLDKQKFSYADLDDVINKNIPSGFGVRSIPIENLSLHFDDVIAKDVNFDRAAKSVGTLGGGNHFIEIDKDEQDYLYLVIHTGSRGFGLQIASYWQKVANEKNPQPNQLSYLDGTDFDAYMNDIDIAQNFAVLNRKYIAKTILDALGLIDFYTFETVHNYIDPSTLILRKGAVEAKAGQQLLIPLNMRDGSLICVGKGNADWNFSAPHGAGRILSRTQAKKELSYDDFVSQMEGIYSSSITLSTLDESPDAYKKTEHIIAAIEPTAKVIKRIMPTYNFKAH